MTAPLPGIQTGPADAARIAAVINAARYHYRDEGQLQEGIAAALAAAHIPAEREVHLSGRDRIDFLAGTTGIEVKIAGRPADVIRQLRRYAVSSRVEALILVTTRARHRAMPPVIGGKPVRVVWIPGGIG